MVHGAKGTANRIQRGAKYQMAGKTGTAQVVGIGQDEQYDVEQVAIRKRDHGLFVGFAPLQDPKIVVAVIVENGQHGSWISPIARKVFDAWLLDQGMLEQTSGAPAGADQPTAQDTPPVDRRFVNSATAASTIPQSVGENL